MSAQHTPGPWTVAGESGNPGEGHVIEASNRGVAWTCNSYDNEADEEIVTAEDVANANLIAAAPDMYDILSELLENNLGPLRGWPATAEAVRAVLAKAEGR